MSKDQDEYLDGESAGESAESTPQTPEGEYEQGFSSDDEFIHEPPPKSVSRGTMAIIMLLLGVVGATYVMVLRSGPSTASAAAKAQSDEAGETINTFLGGGVNNIRLMELMLQKTASVVARFRSYPGTQQIPLSDLRTNPFQFGRTEAAKADLDEDAAKRHREEQTQAAIAEARQLRLQSVLYGSTRKSCIIDGKVYLEGQPVGSFILQEIRPNSIVVGNSVVKLEIIMRREQMP